MSLIEEALELDAEASKLESEGRETFVRIGEIMAKMQDQERWSYIIDPSTGKRFKSYESWVMYRFPNSRSSAFAAKAVIKQLGPIMPREVIKKVDRGNFTVLKKLPESALNNPTVQLLATTLSPKEFESKAQILYPEHHIETTRLWALKPTVSQASVYDEMVEDAIEFYSKEKRITREEAMEYASQDLIEYFNGNGGDGGA